MAGFTKPQLAKQLVLIRQFYAHTLSRTEFDAKMSDMKEAQSAVNAIRQRMLDARRKVDGWIGGDFGRKGLRRSRLIVPNSGSQGSEEWWRLYESLQRQVERVNRSKSRLKSRPSARN